MSLITKEPKQGTRYYIPNKANLCYYQLYTWRGDVVDTAMFTTRREAIRVGRRMMKLIPAIIAEGH